MNSQSDDNLHSEVPSNSTNENENGVGQEQNVDINTSRNQQQLLRRKRKTKNESDSILSITEVFLRIFYPLSCSMDKYTVIGIFRYLNYEPGVIISHGNNKVLISANGWQSLTRSVNLLKCYIEHNMYGKKTSVRLEDCDIEVDIIRFRNEHCVRLRDLTKHDSRIVLNKDEFYMLMHTNQAVLRYLDQLELSKPVIKDYLETSLDKQPNGPLIFGAVDTGIFNRLPHEVNIYKHILEDCSDSSYVLNSCTTKEEETPVEDV